MCSRRKSASAGKKGFLRCTEPKRKTITTAQQSRSSSLHLGLLHAACENQQTLHCGRYVVVSRLAAPSVTVRLRTGLPTSVVLGRPRCSISEPNRSDLFTAGLDSSGPAQQLRPLDLRLQYRASARSSLSSGVESSFLIT